MAAQKAGLNYTQIGIVFGINPLGSIVGSILTGRMISVWGTHDHIETSSGRKRGMMVALVL
jgi:MFS family permease